MGERFPSGLAIARDSLSGITVAFLVRLLDLVVRLILIQSVEGFTIAFPIRSLEGLLSRSLFGHLIPFSCCYSLAFRYC